MPDRLPASPDRQPLKDFSDQHKEGDDKDSSKLSNEQSRQKSDGHGQLHRHSAFDQVFESFFEDGPAANERRHDADYTDSREWLPDAKPYSENSDTNKRYPCEVTPASSVVVVTVLAVVVIVSVFVVVIAAVGAVIQLFNRTFRRGFKGFRYHNALLFGPLLQIAPDQINEFLCRLCLWGASFDFLPQHVAANMPLDDFGHKAIEGPAAGSQELHDRRALLLLLQGFMQGVDLPANAIHPLEELVFVALSMGHG
jgi:hypothetical protein